MWIAVELIARSRSFFGSSGTTKPWAAEGERVKKRNKQNNIDDRVFSRFFPPHPEYEDEDEYSGCGEGFIADGSADHRHHRQLLGLGTFPMYLILRVYE